MLVVDRLTSCFSESTYLRERREAGLHPIDEMKRFRTLTCCLFCSICVSLIFAFDLFTTEFKSSFGLTSGDLSTISTVGLVFCYFTLPYGFLYEYCGPFCLFALAMVTGALGSFLLALTFDGKIPGNTVTISVFYAMLNTCSGLFDIASIVTLCELFPRNRGPVIGLTKVMTGLGSSVLSSISTSFFADNISGFIYFIMVLSIVVGVFAMFLVTLPPYFLNGWRRRGKTADQLAELEALQSVYNSKFVPVRRLGAGFAVAGALLIFFTVSAPITAFTTPSRGAEVAIGVVTILLVACFGVMVVPLRFLGGVDEPAPAAETTEADAALAGKELILVMGEVAPPSAEEAALSDDVVQVSQEPVPAAAAAAAVDRNAPQDPCYPGGVWESIRHVDIWLILIAFTCQTALGTIIMYNGTTISVALGGGERNSGTGALYTAFLGVGSAAGRITMGMYEAFVQHQRHDNRRFLVTMALPIAPAIETVAGVLVLVLPSSAILFPYILIYFGEGMFASVCALLFPCLFERDHGVYYNISFLTTVVAVVLFNRVLFGVFIDGKLKSLGLDVGEDPECNVAECVRTPIIVATVMTAVGAVLTYLVHFRYSRYVHRVRATAAAEAQAAALGQVCDGNRSDGSTQFDYTGPCEPLQDDFDERHH